MVERKIEKLSPYSLEQLYNMVLDIKSYPEFIPWCGAARILKEEEKEIFADLIISFSGFREKYTSKVIKCPYDCKTKEAKILVELIEGPFTFLRNSWVFTEIDNRTKVDFYIGFEFNSKLLDKLIGPIFEKAFIKMINSFEIRANKLYGKIKGVN